ncbi:methyl-accepting chemotaxis protein [Alkalimarinus sediminis]|uniref:Methyl-accepting chemotaxis protein n=1 Tax=Alkalimarinus sediminis TaxID=1632866 RepID=A0A9E8KQL2_9ALTE|nr:methyl-accepting chemotaxis protein [Alkalimarinus sediminis]UZW74887.1 methyl-accepting chemotaxis protein [Alkalimarinus sediminis]
MSWFKNLKIFYKIMLILGVYVVALAINTTIGVSSLLSTQGHLVKLEQKIYDSVILATVNDTLLKRADELLTQAVSFSEDDLKLQGIESINQLTKNLQQLEKLDTERLTELKDIDSNVKKYQAIAVPLVEAMLSDEADFSALQGQIKAKAELFEATNKALTHYQQIVNKEFKVTIGKAVASGEDALYTSSAISAVFFVVLALFITYIASAISSTANQLSGSLKELSEGEGELSQRIPVNGRDELGSTASNFNSFMDKLSSIVRSIMNVSNPLLETANDLDSNTQQVRSVTDQLGVKAREAKQAMDEITQSISEISTSASDASVAMQDTEDRTNKGLEIVTTTIANSKDLNSQIINAAELVERLAKDTENVANILDVISTIAEQTNLLALNAAIEAARAGEQGRGFAVVADEVRALASKTGDATTEIRNVLNRLEEAAVSTVNAMESAKGQSEMSENCAVETGDYLEQIKQQVEQVNGMNMTIAAATEEQTMVVSNVSEIITAMVESVESTEVSFSELAVLANKLLSASDSLKESTSQFKL